MRYQHDYGFSALKATYASREDLARPPAKPIKALPFDRAARSALFEYGARSGFAVRLVGPCSKPPDRDPAAGGPTVIQAVQAADATAWFFLVLEGVVSDIAYEPIDADDVASNELPRVIRMFA